MITVMILQGGEDKTLQIYMDKAFLPVWVMVCLIAVLLCMVTIITVSTTIITLRLTDHLPANSFFFCWLESHG